MDGAPFDEERRLRGKGEFTGNTQAQASDSHKAETVASVVFLVTSPSSPYIFRSCEEASHPDFLLCLQSFPDGDKKSP